MPDQVQNTVAVDSGVADEIESLLEDEERDEAEASHSSQSEGDTGEDEDQPEEQPAPLYTVKIDGKETQVPLGELVRGYQRNADYTQKTQQLSTARREAQAEFDAVQQERAKYSQLLTLLDRQITEGTQEPNWDQLRATDPVGYASQWAQHQQLQQRRQAIAGEQQRLQQQQTLDNQRQLQERVAVESERLLDVIPTWKDSKRAATERKALMEYGQQVGFTPEELGSVYDHRAVALLRKAWLWDQAAAARRGTQARTEAAQPRVLTPGMGNSPRTAELTRARQRLAKTGSVDAAAALFERLL